MKVVRINNKVKYLFTGRELIIALGEQFNNVHDIFKDHYDDYFDGDELIGPRVFHSIKDIIIAIENGNYEMKHADLENKYLDSDEKIKYVKDFRVKRTKFSIPLKIITMILLSSAFYIIGIISTIVFVLRFIGII